MYKGEIQLDSDNVGRMVRLAKFIHLDEVKDICFRFMMETLDISNCVQYWKCCNHVDDTAFKTSFLHHFTSNLDRVIRACDMQEIPQELMEAAVERDDLNVSDEMEVCE
jgi:hypothetical protein